MKKLNIHDNILNLENPAAIDFFGSEKINIHHNNIKKANLNDLD